MEILEIYKLPTVINNNHESLYRSYQTLQLVIEMLKRGDSKETILETVNTIECLGMDYHAITNP